MNEVPRSHPGQRRRDSGGPVALAAAVSTLAAHIHAATYRLLVLIAEFDRREVWAAQGALSCAHWLSWACGIDTHTAREKVRVARALTELPLLSDALAKGELGYSKVRALTRIATSENEADLLNIGLHGTAQHVEKFVRLYRRAKRAEETERADAQHQNRGLSFWHEDDGAMVPHGRFPPEMGARILGALDAAMAAHAEEQPPAGWDDEGSAPEDVPRGTSRPDSSTVDDMAGAGAREPVAGQQGSGARESPTDVPRGTFMRGPSRTVRRADALAWMAERVFESGDAPALAPNRHEIVVHVEAEVLSNGGAGRCEIEHRTATAAETARRLCCDAGIVPVVDGPNGEPLSVGRRTRSIPPAVRRALASRDRGCRFPGCPATQRLHGHHVRHWAEGGENLPRQPRPALPDPPSPRARGRIRRAASRRRRVPVHQRLWSGIRPPRRRETSSPDTIVVRNASLGLAIDCETATAHWHGERIDYDHALMVAMASWDSGDTRPEAGPAAGDWNPS